jgi:putative acetyltransferase
MAIRDEAGKLRDALALAPLAVLPSHQKRGIGTALVERGLSDARRLGHAIVIVLGHPEYYPRFGFAPAAAFGIRAPFDVRPEAFMALALQEGALMDARGEAVYAPEFMAV